MDNLRKITVKKVAVNGLEYTIVKYVDIDTGRIVDTSDIEDVADLKELEILCAFMCQKATYFSPRFTIGNWDTSFESENWIYSFITSDNSIYTESSIDWTHLSVEAANPLVAGLVNITNLSVGKHEIHIENTKAATNLTYFYNYTVKFNNNLTVNSYGVIACSNQGNLTVYRPSWEILVSAGDITANSGEYRIDSPLNTLSSTDHPEEFDLTTLTDNTSLENKTIPILEFSLESNFDGYLHVSSGSLKLGLGGLTQQFSYRKP